MKWLFELDERQKQAAFMQRLVIRVNELVRELTEQEKRGPEIFPQLMDGWSGEERLSFENNWNDNWNDDSFLAGLEEPTTPEVLPDHIHIGERSRKRPAEVVDGASVSKQPKSDYSLKRL